MPVSHSHSAAGAGPGERLVGSLELWRDADRMAGTAQPLAGSGTSRPTAC